VVAGRRAELTDRRAERDVLDRLVAAVRAGESRALVLHGEPGVGKTALLDYVAGRAADCQLARATGVQSEMELAFAALHQLCVPLLDRLEASAGSAARRAVDRVRPQRGAATGPVPGRAGRVDPAFGCGRGTTASVPDR